MYNPYNPNYANPYFTQNYNAPQYAQPYTQPQQPQVQQAPTNTNKIYVVGIEDVRARALPQNSDFIFLDNDKPILYQKVVDSKGQFEVKAFTITPYSPQEQPKSEGTIDLSNYVKLNDLEPIKAELNAIKEKLATESNYGRKETL